ncbi:restriction endonuclease subunit S [Flavobacterium columnare]|uniref:restriction endonuclease subunit S n=1 Tax=Flavobacterium columnare TaxID=996 RepID=UPI003B9F20D8
MQNLKYITFVPFANFNLWDTKRYTSKMITSTFPIVSLESCIVEQNKKYKIFEEEEKEFGILGVNNKEGIFDAYTQKGKEINQPYKKMETGWLAYNPYRINVGSIGIKLKEHQNDYISPAYVVFSCNEKLLPEFLFFLFKTSVFNTVINESTTGSVRQNLTFETLKSIQIPLPTVEEQRKIIANFNTKQQIAKQQIEKVKSLEAEVESYLFEVLGISIEDDTKDKKKGFKLVQYKNVERWAVDHLNKYSKMSFLFNGKYQPVKLKELILSYQYGLSEKAEVENIGIPMLRMNNIFNSELDTKNLKYIKKTTSIDKYILNIGDILFNRTNSKELVGKTAIFQEKDTFTFASYLIRVVINQNIADNFYINHLFNTSILQIQKDMVSRQITGQANINAQEMQDFLFPLPPIEIQKQIASHINSIKAQIRELTQLSAKNKEEAIVEFEKEIFK